MTWNPDFDFCVTYGESGEKLCAELVGLPDGAGVEVKRKSRRDAGFYVESHQWPHGRGYPDPAKAKPSGINTTKAHYWAYVIADTGIVVLIPTRLLIEAARDSREADTAFSDNPTHGRLVSFQHLLTKEPVPDKSGQVGQVAPHGSSER